MDEILLLGKKIVVDKCPILLKYTPDAEWQKYWTVMGGQWEFDGEWLVGTERGNKGGILFSKARYEENVMLSFTVKTVLPATRDLNAVYCANWDEKTDYLGDSYVCGLNGWYEGKSGIERNLGSNIYTTTSLYHYTPGKEVRISCGAIDGHNFMTVDGVLISELIDPNPIKGGYVGFSPYCTKLKIKDIEIREIFYERDEKVYEPEF